MSIALPRILETGKVPSSLLLIGAKLPQAIDLAKQLLGSSLKIDSGNHPDLHLYTPEEKSKLHSIASIHKLIEEMALPPFEGAFKVFIIEEAEKMLPSGSNALLKTLEEPSDDTFFILLSSDPDRLLPTVRSRLFPISFEAAQSASFDVSPYFQLAEEGNYDQLFEHLPDLDQAEPQALFIGCLEWAAQKRDPVLFKKMSELVTQGQKAVEHHLKLRTVFLNILFRS